MTTVQYMKRRAEERRLKRLGLWADPQWERLDELIHEIPNEVLRVQIIEELLKLSAIQQ